MTNPLLSIQHPISFGDIQASHVKPALQYLLEVSEHKLQAIESETAEATWKNTLGALEEATADLEECFGVVQHLDSVMTSDELRAVYTEMLGPVTDFFTGIVLRPKMWERVRALRDSPRADELNSEQARLLQKTVQEFIRNGAELGGEAKQRLVEINQGLSEKCNSFRQHVLDSTNEFSIYVENEQELEGFPEVARAGAKEAAEKEGKSGYKLTLQAPCWVPALRFLENRALREQLYRGKIAVASEGEYNNRQLIEEILQLRDEKARLLGFKSFSDLITEDRMAASGDGVGSFLTDLTEKVKSHAEREHQELLEFVASLENAPSEALQPWDKAFYAEKMRQQQFDFDEEALRPYFELERVLQGMYDITATLFGISVEAVDTMPVWHESVRTYQIKDKSGEVLCYFYVDLFPRETKRAGAWMNQLITGGPLETGARPHVSLFCGNFTPPVAGSPSLLTHSEVRVVFHEFGHLLHQALSKVSVRSLSGTNVAWDFVELPSQILENWIWERDGLARIAVHYETGEPLGEDLVDRLLAARTFREGTASMRQLSFATVDYLLHTDFVQQSSGVSAIEYAREVAARFTSDTLPVDYPWICSFSHIFSSPVGYASGYYSYKWAEVLDADAFTRFKKEGVFNPTTGAEFRDAVLAKGNSDDPAELFRSFMGRDPDGDALLQRGGLL